MCRACRPETPPELRRARHINGNVRAAASPPELVASVVVASVVEHRLRIETAKPLLRMALMTRNWRNVERALAELETHAPVEIDLREARGAD